MKIDVGAVAQRKYEKILLEFYQRVLSETNMVETIGGVRQKQKDTLEVKLSIFPFANAHFWYDEGYSIYKSAFDTLIKKGLLCKTRLRKRTRYSLTYEGVEKAKGMQS